MLKTSYEKKESFRDYYLPFEFKGNKDGRVISSKGDGEMGTTSGKETRARLNAALVLFPNEKIVRLTVNYTVEEMKGDNTTLVLNASQDYSLGGFFDEGANTARKESNDTVKKECASTLTFASVYNPSIIQTSFKGECHGYMIPQPWDVSIMQNWLPVNELEMKIDDKGNDLTGIGNIGVKGKIRFRIMRVDNITVTTRVDEEQPTPSPSANAEMTYGSEEKLGSIPQTVSSVLGHGYDACGYYADMASVKILPVLDIAKVNDYKRLAKRPIEQLYHLNTTGESVKEYTEKLATKTNLSASVNVFGGFAKAEVERSFNVTREEKSCYKYASRRSLYKESEYVLSCYSPNQLFGFLHKDFKDALNNLSAMKFIEAYGTHVIIGMALGTRFTFNLSYRESSRKHSEASSFKDSESVGYKDNGEIKALESNSKSLAEEVFDKFKNEADVSPEKLKGYAELIKAVQGVDSKSVPSGGAGGGEFSRTYSKDEAWSLSEEDKSTVIKCFCVGGDASVGALINDSNDTKYYPEWVKSNRSNCVFCDFPKGGLIPIYELIPTGYRLTAQDVKRAFEEHMTWSVITNKMESRVTYFEFNTRGQANTENIQKENSSDKDDEIGTKSGKPTYWELHVELLNFDGGKCGFGICLIVKENGSGGPASILKNSYTVEIPLELGFSQMAINTDYFGGKPVFDARATWTGEYHGWHDATSDVLRGTAGNVLCCNGNAVEIMIDDKGRDMGNVGVRGKIMIPWIGY